MFLNTKTIFLPYTRVSKNGKSHTYNRRRTVGIFSCDVCRIQFERDLVHMDRRRFSNEYNHVCANCDQKRYAQNKGVERRRLWNLPVDTDIDITKI